MSHAAVSGQKAKDLLDSLGVQPTYVAVPVSQVRISGSNPREDVDPGALHELAESIKRIGIQVPLKATKDSDGCYGVFDGGRRFRAAIMAGLKEVPLALYENLTTEAALFLAMVFSSSLVPLSPVEEGKGFQALLENENLDLERLAATVGKSVAYITTKIAVSNLPREILGVFERRELPRSDLALVIRCPPEGRMELIRRLKEFRQSCGGKPSRVTVEAFTVQTLQAGGHQNRSLQAAQQELLPAGLRRKTQPTTMTAKGVLARARGRKVAGHPLDIYLRGLRDSLGKAAECLRGLGRMGDEELSLSNIRRLTAEGILTTSVFAAMEEADNLAGELEEALARLERLGHDIPRDH